MDKKNEDISFDKAGCITLQSTERTSVWQRISIYICFDFTGSALNCVRQIGNKINESI
jgi:hypothetical protein